MGGLQPSVLSHDATLVSFDSTQFPDGTEVVILYKVWVDSQATPYTAEGRSTVKNKFLSYGRHDFEVAGTAGQKGMPTVASACAAMNIAKAVEKNALGWASIAFYDDLQLDASVIYLHSHGTSDRIVANPPIANAPSTWMYSDFDEHGWSSFPTHYYYIMPLDEANYPWSVIESVQYSVGSDNLPPYNASARPNIRLAFNDGCLTGNDNAFAEAYLWPYADHYGGWTTNQSQCGWTISKYSDATKPCAEAFWHKLRDRYTVDQARIELYSAYVLWCINNNATPNYPSDPRDLVHVFGDYYTRLKGVYSNTSSDSPQYKWFKE